MSTLDDMPIQPQYATIPEEQAIQLVLNANTWINSALGVSSSKFFQSVDSSTFKGKDVPIFKPDSEPNSEINPDHTFFWVYDSLINSVRNARKDADYPFQWRVKSDDVNAYSEALDLHIANLQAGNDSFIKSAGSSGAGQEMLTGALFNRHLAYALMVTTHEPFHPWIGEKLEEAGIEYSYLIDESLTTYLGIEALKAFAQEIKDSNPQIYEALMSYIEQHKVLFELFRLAYFKLMRIYNLASEGMVERPPEAQAILNELDEILILVEKKTDIDTIRVNEVTNARILERTSYFTIPLVEEYFRDNSINPLDFIKDINVTKQHIALISSHIKEKLNVEPDNLDERWNNLTQTIRSGSYSNYQT